MTVRECLTAADDLAADGITVGVIDAYSVKPIDAVGAARSALERTGLVIVVEDHRVEGGLGDAVLGSLAETGSLSGRVVKLGVHDMPGSGTAEEMRAWAGIDAASIADRVRERAVVATAPGPRSADDPQPTAAPALRRTRRR